jgi:hypothetical protein
MAKVKFTFNTKLYLCCSDDENRPAMNCIHFKEGFAYATNAYVAIKQSLEYSQIINPEMLNGKSLHSDSYRAIMSYDIAQCEEEGVLCKSDDGQEAFFTYHKLDYVKIPDIEKFIQSRKERKNEMVEYIGLNPKYLNDLYKAMCFESGVQLTFCENNGPVMVTAPNFDNQIGVIMPVDLSSLFD